MVLGLKGKSRLAGTIGSGRRTLAETLESAVLGKRLSADEALDLLRSDELPALADAAYRVRQTKHPDSVVTYLIDRNVNYTNVCVARCKFCNFKRRPGDPGSYVLDRGVIARKIEETIALGGTGILLQGGMNPALTIDYYEDLLRYLRSRFPIHLHCFSPPEIVVLAKVSKLSVREVIRRLKAAGLDSIPGGGAEILNDRRRKEISPGKCSADEWLDVMRIAHEEGIQTTATMVLGGGETLEERVEHLERIRRLQDETGGFVAFIPWTACLAGTEMEGAVERPCSPVEYLKTLAVARIYLDNIDHLQVSWLTQGLDTAQVALYCGADDVGSIMMEENVLSAAGSHRQATRRDLVELIRDAGFQPMQRDSLFRRLPVFS